MPHARIEALECRRLMASSLRGDLTYGDAGKAGVRGGGVNLFDSAGRLVVVQGVEEDIEFGPAYARVSRATVGGDRDNGFGRRGAITLGGSDDVAATLQPDDKLVLVSGRQVYRLTTAGRYDTSFSGDGVSDVLAGFGLTGPAGDVRVLAGGKIRVTVGTTDVVQLNADGTADNGFGTNGRLRLEPTAFGGRPPLPPGVARLDARGRVYVFVGRTGKPEVSLVRLTDAGQIDPAFAGGRLGLGDTVSANPYIGFEAAVPVLDFLAGDRLLLTLQPADAPDGGRRLVRVNSDGRVDAGFGDGGRVDFFPSTSEEPRRIVEGVTAAPDPESGAIYVSTVTRTAFDRTRDRRVVRLRADGSVDNRFRTQAAFVTSVDPAGRAYNNTTRLAFRGPATVDARNRLFLDGTDGRDDFSVSGRRVTVNGRRLTFAAAPFAAITVDLGPGGGRYESDDRVRTNVTAGVGEVFVKTGRAPDTITVGDDSIVFASGGNDVVTAGSRCGIQGGDGDDVIDVSDDAQVFGGDGDDRITCGVGGRGSTGKTLIFGEAGDDRVTANDTAKVFGGVGDDVVTASRPVTFEGGAGADVLRLSRYSPSALTSVFTDQTAEDARRRF